jgi:protein ImuB
VLRLAAPLADPVQLGALLAERLSTLALPEPVRACELRSGPLVSRVLGSGGLWQAGEHGGGVAAQAPELIERLRARLGPDAVYGLQIVEDHRPEAAWKVREPVMTTSTIQSGLQNDPGRNAVDPSLEGFPGRFLLRQRVSGSGSPSWRSASGQDHFATRSETESSWPFGRRPVWLLPVPRLLNERDGLPRRRGALRLLGAPERIETGWWDGGEVARDYYAAVDSRGARLWVFREREPPHRWFLHGVFG